MRRTIIGKKMLEAMRMTWFNQTKRAYVIRKKVDSECVKSVIKKKVKKMNEVFCPHCSKKLNESFIIKMAAGINGRKKGRHLSSEDAKKMQKKQKKKYKLTSEKARQMAALSHSKKLDKK